MFAYGSDLKAMEGWAAVTGLPAWLTDPSTTGGLWSDHVRVVEEGRKDMGWTCALLCSNTEPPASTCDCSSSFFRDRDLISFVYVDLDRTFATSWLW